MIPYSKLRSEIRPPLIDQLPLAAPLSILIEPTNSCNFKCRFCPESFDDYTDQAGGMARMEWRDYVRLVSEISAMGKIKVLKFYMLGEPLLHPDLSKMIRLAVDCGIAERTELTTNGSALTAPKCGDLIQSGLDYLRISIYGMNADKFQKATQTKFDPAKIERNIQVFKAIRGDGVKPYLYVKMLDCGDEEENRLFMDTYGSLADEACLEQPMNWSGYGARDLLAEATSIPQVGRFGKRVCAFPFYTMVINANGDVTCCCVDWNKKTKVGNIHEGSLSDIWHGEEMRKFRLMQLEGRRHENEACKNCSYLLTSPDNLDEVEKEKWEEILV